MQNMHFRKIIYLIYFTKKMVLCQGTFTTPILAIDTKINYKILNNYEARTSFRFFGSDYEFCMNKWINSPINKNEYTNTFDKFAQLVLDKFSKVSSCFGFISKYNDSISYHYNEDHIIQMIQYSIWQIFVCVDEIVQKYFKDILDYANYHLKHQNLNNYEEFIHWMACHCLLNSNFLAPDIEYPIIEYVLSPQSYNGAEFQKKFDESTLCKCISCRNIITMTTEEVC
jgi:hypothetical protein